MATRKSSLDGLSNRARNRMLAAGWQSRNDLLAAAREYKQKNGYPRTAAMPTVLHTMLTEVPRVGPVVRGELLAWATGGKRG